MQPNQVLGIVLLKLDELSRQRFLCGVWDRDCKGANQKLIRVGSSRKLSLGQIYNGLCECWLLNLKDCEHEKRRAALAILLCRGGARHFHLGGPLEGPVLQQGELSMVCVGLSERDLKNFGGPLGGPGKTLGVSGPPGTPLAPLLLLCYRWWKDLQWSYSRDCF